MIIERQVIETITEHAEEAYPAECCGFLFGIENPRRLTLAKRATNVKVANREKEFEIDSKEYLLAEAFASTQGIDLIGIYHSHPDHPAIPSEYDRSHAMPFFSYIILSVIKGKVVNLTSWVLNRSSQFEAELFLKETD